jgi:hypothetical protein
VVGRSSRHHGWENPRLWEEPSLGLSRTDGARLAACHRFRKGDGVARQKRKEVEASLPARISRARVWLPARRRLRCRNWQATSGPKYARQTRSKKSGQGRVNGGLARGERRRVIPSAGASSETTNRESASPQRRERTGARLRVARDRHPAAVTSPKAVRWSRDRGCNGHRILRRVPADGRHPGSSRSVGFHVSATTVVLAVCPILRPVSTLREKDIRPGCSSHESGRGVRVNEVDRDRGVRGSVASAPWEENAHAITPGREAVEDGIRVA